MRRWFSKRADVVVTAIDGATGKTVWQSVWPRRQGNFQTHKWRGRNPTPAIGGGVLVVADYSYGLQAYHAKTGELKWSRGGGDTIAGNSAPLGPVITGKVVVYWNCCSPADTSCAALRCTP
jgi:outer membrane protein assembly factor BamB